MSYIEFDTKLSKKERALQDAARTFGREVMRPAGIALDAIEDPADAIAPASQLWDVFRQYRELGLHKLLIPPAFGGQLGRVSGTARRLAFEQLGYADAGLAISLDLSSLPFALATLSASREVRNWARQYCQDTDANMVGCWAITEPAHGTDWVLATTRQGANPDIVPSLTAEKKGQEYILNGRKSALVTNGTIATHAVLHIGLDRSKGLHGSGLALCPLDLPGISKGAPMDKLGKRPLNQGEIIFEEVRLPVKNMLLTVPGLFRDNAIGKGIIGLANSQMGLASSSQARAIADEAIQFAREHTLNGAPLLEQPEIRLKLFHMFKASEAARRMAHGVVERSPLGEPNLLVNALLSVSPTFSAAGYLIQRSQEMYLDQPDNQRFQALLQYAKQRSTKGKKIIDWGMYGMASKVFATETAFAVAKEAMSMMGDEAFSQAGPIEKMFRDARTAMIEDGANEALGLVAAENLLAEGANPGPTGGYTSDRND